MLNNAGFRRSVLIGPSFFLMDSSKSQTAKSVRFMPDINKEGNYHVYTYFQKLDNGAEQTQVSISDGSQVKETVINRSEVQVIGQTSGEWVSLGKYKLPKGKKAFVEISTKGANGKVIADAVLFVAEE